MNKKKLVIVSYYFPPFNNIASRRWAEMLPQLYHHFDIYVFTTNAEGELEIPAKLANIIRFENIFLKGDNTKKSKRSVSKQFLYNIRKGLRTLDSTFLNFYLKNRISFSSNIQKINPDYIITSVGPFSSALFGLRSKRLISKIKWIVDIRDSISLYPHFKRGFIKRKLDRFIDYSIIAKSDSVITVSDSLAEIFSDFYLTKVHVIYNGYSEPINDKSFNIKQDDSRKVIFYGGKIYEHQLKSFEILCDAISKSIVKYKIMMRLVNHEYKNNILSISKNFKVDIEVLPQVSDQLFKEEANNADILLILESVEYNNKIGKGTLTGKLFNYLPLDGPILSVCRLDSDINIILKRTKRGVVYDNVDNIKKFLDLVKRESFIGNNSVTNYSRTAQANQLIRLLNELK